MWVKCTHSVEVKSIRIAVPAVLGMLWWVTVIRFSKDFVRGCGKYAWARIPRWWAKLCGNAKYGVCAIKHGNWRDWKYLPQGQTLYIMGYNLFVSTSFKRNLAQFLTCIKISYSTKLNPSPPLPYPMHLNKPLFKDGICRVHYVLTPLIDMFFSRRCRRWVRRRWRCVDRVSPVPKLLLVVWVSAYASAM